MTYQSLALKIASISCGNVWVRFPSLSLSLSSWGWLCSYNPELLKFAVILCACGALSRETLEIQLGTLVTP